jgi:hypothetical protein
LREDKRYFFKPLSPSNLTGQHSRREASGGREGEGSRREEGNQNINHRGEEEHDQEEDDEGD